MYENSAILTIAVPPALKQAIRKRAFEAGVTPSKFVREQLAALFLTGVVENLTVPSDNGERHTTTGAES